MGGRRGRVSLDPRVSTVINMQISVLIQDADVISEPKETSAGQELYFEVLELQPIKLSLSFMRTERVSSEEKYAAIPQSH